MTYGLISIKNFSLSRNLGPPECARTQGRKRHFVYSWERRAVSRTLFLVRIVHVPMTDPLDIYFLFSDYHRNNIWHNHMMQYSAKGAQTVSNFLLKRIVWHGTNWQPSST